MFINVSFAMQAHTPNVQYLNQRLIINVHLIVKFFLYLRTALTVIKYVTVKVLFTLYRLVTCTCHVLQVNFRLKPRRQREL